MWSFLLFYNIFLILYYVLLLCIIYNFNLINLGAMASPFRSTLQQQDQQLRVLQPPISSNPFLRKLVWSSVVYNIFRQSNNNKRRCSISNPRNMRRRLLNFCVNCLSWFFLEAASLRRWTYGAFRISGRTACQLRTKFSTHKDSCWRPTSRSLSCQRH